MQQIKSKNCSKCNKEFKYKNGGYFKTNKTAEKIVDNYFEKKGLNYKYEQK